MADQRDDQTHTQLQTAIITVDPLQPDDALLMPAAQAIRQGELVAARKVPDRADRRGHVG